MTCGPWGIVFAFFLLVEGHGAVQAEGKLSSCCRARRKLPLYCRSIQSPLSHAATGTVIVGEKFLYAADCRDLDHLKGENMANEQVRLQ